MKEFVRVYQLLGGALPTEWILYENRQAQETFRLCMHGESVAKYSYASLFPGTYVLRLGASTTIVRPSASFRRAKLAERGQEALLNLAQRLNVNTADIQLVTQDTLDSVVNHAF